MLSWVRRHPLWSVAIFVLVLFVVANVLAYRHARAMLTFDTGGERTPSPQSLTALQKLGVLLGGVTVPRPENSRSPGDLGMPFETHCVESTGGGCLEVWVVSPPGGRGVVLMFHGYSAAKASLLDEAKAFYDLGYAVVLVDFRGSGGSLGHTTSLGYHEADDVAAAVELVRAQELPGPLVLYGQSMGGAALLRCLAVHDVRPDAVIVEAVYDRLLTTVENRFALMGVPSFPAARLLLFWGGVQAGFSGFDHNPAEYARSCTCPALVLFGEDDANVRPDEAEAVYENLAGRKRREGFAGVGHVSLYGAAPERWRSVVGPFLAGLR
jgi:alpha-beta hydrolase superfamily lysophospholipase